jgi:hypothetical protein
MHIFLPPAPRFFRLTEILDCCFLVSLGGGSSVHVYLAAPQEG